MELNYYKSLKQPAIEKNVSVDWWLAEIKSGKQYRQEIELAREYGKGCEEYDEIKLGLPAVTWNFKFNGYKIDANIIGSTGFLYYDIDKPGFNTGLLDRSKVYSYFSSLSNQGISIIVQASGITESNFLSSYKVIAQDLGIGAYIDPQAVKRTQFTVLTYDEQVFVNKDSLIYTPSEPIIQDKAEKPAKVPLAPNIGEEKKGIHIGASGTFFRYSNADLFVQPDGTAADPNGYDVVSVYLPSSIKEGKRKHTLLAFCNNLVYLNMNKTQEEVFNHLMDRNNKRCLPPLKSGEIAGIVKSVFNYKANGTLRPIIKKRRKILFGKNCGMDKSDKQSYTANQIAEWKRCKTRENIYKAIEASQCKKITAESISIESGIPCRTIKRYWKDFKDKVKGLNKSRK